MASRCPVICSCTSSLPEVVVQAGERIEPKNEASIRSAIENVIYSDEHKENLINEGLKQQQKFSWEKCAEETYKLYSDLV